jgi:ADP-heptose:LPS heptosyltransferase
VSGRRVLVARLDNAGDVLLTGPAVRAVAASGADVISLTSSAGRAAAELLPGVSRVITFDAPWVAYEPPATDRSVVEQFIDHIAGLHLDEAIICTSYHQSPLPLALILRLAGVPVLAATSVDYPGTLLDVRHRMIEGHEVEQSLSLTAALGYALPRGDDGRLRIRGPLAGAGPFTEPYVVVHPGASVPARGIDPHLAGAATELLAERGWRVAVTGSAAERDLTARVAGDLDNVVDLGGLHDLRGLAGVLAHAAAVVVGNTGPMHLAAAVGTPVVPVFAPVVPVHRWMPWRMPTIILGDQAVTCAGCRARRCPLPIQRCTSGITAAAIADAVTSLTSTRLAVAV